MLSESRVSVSSDESEGGLDDASGSRSDEAMVYIPIRESRKAAFSTTAMTVNVDPIY